MTTVVDSSTIIPITTEETITTTKEATNTAAGITSTTIDGQGIRSSKTNVIDSKTVVIEVVDLAIRMEGTSTIDAHLTTTAIKTIEVNLVFILAAATSVMTRTWR